MQRLSLLLIPAVIAIALFLGFESTSTRDESDLEITRLNYDAYSEGINSVLYDESGNISYTLQASRQVHFSNDVTEIESPSIRLFQEGKSPWKLIANSGRISASSAGPDGARQLIDLIGNVEVHNLDEFGNNLVISTEFLSIDLDSNSLETEEAVKVVTDNTEQTSIGMYADLNQKTILLIKDIRGNYEPPQQ
jgi:LPS export ABC transporter protein LptC